MLVQKKTRELGARAREVEQLTRQRDRVLGAFNAQLIADAVLDAKARSLGPPVTPSSARPVVLDVLEPFVVDRVNLFDFIKPQSIWNFAVYLHDPRVDLLSVFARRHDDRIAVRNRSWQRGVGHVGICFARKEMIITEDLVRSPELFSSAQAGAPTSESRYRSAASIPIQRDGETVGVLVITSSEPGQFTKEEHGLIFDKMGQNLSRLFTMAKIEWGSDASESSGS